MHACIDHIYLYAVVRFYIDFGNCDTVLNLIYNSSTVAFIVEPMVEPQNKLELNLSPIALNLTPHYLAKLERLTGLLHSKVMQFRNSTKEQNRLFLVNV